jgi:hypothetical protein
MTRPCTFFMLLKATRHWHELGACEQQAELDHTRLAVFNGYPDLRMSRYAAGAFHGSCTDVIVWETPDAAQYHEAIESLRERAFFGAPLFEIVDVIAAVEDDGFDAEAVYPPFAALPL